MRRTLIYAHADTEMKRRAIEKASSDICEVNARSAVPDVLDDDTLKRLYGLRKLHVVMPTSGIGLDCFASYRKMLYRLFCSQLLCFLGCADLSV